MNKPREYNSETIERLQKRIRPEKREQAKKRMLLAARIDDVLKEKGLNNQEFAFMMGKKPSEISKWLSGTHNFTTETLWEIERVLHIQLVAGPLPQSREQELNDIKTFITNEVTKALDKYLAYKVAVG